MDIPIKIKPSGRKLYYGINPIVEVGEIKINNEILIYKTTHPTFPLELTCAPIAANLFWNLQYNQVLSLDDIYKSKYLAGEIYNGYISQVSGPRFFQHLPADLEIWCTYIENQLITLDNMLNLMSDLGLKYSIIILDVESLGFTNGHSVILELDNKRKALINSQAVDSYYLFGENIFENSTISGFVVPCKYGEIDSKIIPIESYTENIKYNRYCNRCGINKDII